MQDAHKKEIQLLVENHVSQFPSQAQAVAVLKNVSEATIVQIRKNRWDAISDDMWRNIGKQVGFSNRGSWSLVETMNFKYLTSYFSDAQEFGNVFAIVADAGSGKSASADWFAKNRPNVYHLTCAEFWNRKIFLQKLLEKMGKESGGGMSELMDDITETLLKQETPLIILDEFDKLDDKSLCFFVTLYNMLKGKCGMVLLGTDFLQKRVLKGLKNNRKGYSEIMSRIGRRFIQLPGTSREEIFEICKANGVDDVAEISNVYNECEGDLRRVERVVHKTKVKNSRKAVA